MSKKFKRTYPLKNGRARKIISSLKAIMPSSSSDPATQPPDPSLIPRDGVYTVEQLCTILKLTRQNLGYHTSEKKPARKRLYYVRRPNPPTANPNAKKKRGAKPFYVTAVEFYRFLIVNAYPVPPSVHAAIENYNKYYTTADWEHFKKYYKSNTSGLPEAAQTVTDDWQPPKQGAVLPPPLAQPTPFAFTEKPITLAETPLPNVS